MQKALETKRILLAEDDPKDVQLTLEALGSDNLAGDVAVVRDGVEALDYLYRRGPFVARTKANPVVMLLDLKLPKVDGLEVLRQLKGDSKVGLIPVVVFTSSRQEKDVLSSYTLGANAYVVKPVVFDEFVKAIKQLGVFWALLNEPPPGST